MAKILTKNEIAALAEAILAYELRYGHKDSKVSRLLASHEALREQSARRLGLLRNAAESMEEAYVFRLADDEGRKLFLQRLQAIRAEVKDADTG